MRSWLASLALIAAFARADALDEAAARLVDGHALVGLVVGHHRAGATTFRAYGQKQFARLAPPSADDFFEIGSITKTYTATLLAREVLLGTVTLGTTAGELWPELRGTDGAGLTLEQLATHRSGLPRIPDEIFRADPKDPYAKYGTEDLLETLRKFRLTQPGPHPYAYSNLGVGLLGYLLSQRLHGQSYTDYLAKNLLRPLELSDTSLNLGDVTRNRLAEGHDELFAPVPLWNFDVLAPAGALKATARDLMKYLRFNLEAARFEGDAPDLLRDAARLAQTPRANLPDGGRIGLIWSIQENYLGKSRVIQHTGATGGYRASVWLAPEENEAALWLTNTSVDAHCVSSALTGQACELPWIDVPADRTERYVGHYFSEEIFGQVTIARTGDTLTMQWPQQPKFKLWAASETKFWIVDGAATAEFTADGAEFVFDQDGRSLKFKRLRY